MWPTGRCRPCRGSLILPGSCWTSSVVEVDAQLAVAGQSNGTYPVPVDQLGLCDGVLGRLGHEAESVAPLSASPLLVLTTPYGRRVEQVFQPDRDKRRTLPLHRRSCQTAS
jgi:hypothetical protein